jgi:hypothetical protein
MNTEAKQHDEIVSFRLLRDGEQAELTWASGLVNTIPLHKLQRALLDGIELPGISLLESNVTYTRKALGKNIFVRTGS